MNQTLLLHRAGPQMDCAPRALRWRSLASRLIAASLLMFVWFGRAQSPSSSDTTAAIEVLKQLTGFKCDSVHVDETSDTVVCEGHVSATLGESSFIAGELRYDSKTGTIEITKTFTLKHEGKSLAATDPKTKAVIDVKNRSLKVIGRTSISLKK